MKKIINILILIFIVLISLNVYATTSFKVSFYSNKNTLNPGEEIEVILKLTNFAENEKGINVIMAKLEYDKTIFETVKQDDIESIEFWSKPTYNEGSGEFVTDAYKFVDESHDALKIKFKVKDNIDSKKVTQIKLANFVSSDGNNDIECEDTSITFKIEVDDKSGYSSNDLVFYIICLIVLIFIVSLVIVLIKRKK